MVSGRTGKRSGSPARERILDAALEVFSERGFAGATTRDISAKADVNEVTLFRHFDSKKGLYAAVISERSPIAEVGRNIEFDTDLPVDELLRANAASVLSVLRANRRQFMLIMGDAWRPQKSRNMMSRLAVERGITIVAGLMEALMDVGKMRRGDPEVAARAMVGMIQSYFLNVDILAGRRRDPDEDARMLDGFVSIFLDGTRSGVRR
ncbi:MAG: TetR/AcrR family transcriptional regulator [Thermoplasmata archaeon]|nr:TetR/AcrR family transcriptional regulator [Thermoplasmata archaeon]